MNNDLEVKTIEILLQEINEIYSKKKRKIDKKLIGEAFSIEPLGFVDRGLLVFSQKEYSKRLEKLGKYQNKYRYYYFEDFQNNKEHSVIVIMFNPSSANVENDDPTIKNCRDLLKNKYSKMEIINIFAERNPDAKKISIDGNSYNISFIESFLNERINIDVVLAWGYGKEKYYKNEIDKIKNNLKNNPQYIIGLNQKCLDLISRRNYHPANNAWASYCGFNFAAELKKITTELDA